MDAEATARFAVLCHNDRHGHNDQRGVHFDFLLEFEGSLRTWALPQPPDSAAEMVCDALPDHRLAYLDYEGPVSGDRGTVAAWDRGTFSVETIDDSRLVVQLRGEKLHGRVTLTKLVDTTDRWRFTLVSSG